MRIQPDASSKGCRVSCGCWEVAERWRNTFATIDGKVDRGLLTCCVEVPTPKYNILAAEITNQRLTLDLGRIPHTIHSHTHIRPARLHSRA